MINVKVYHHTFLCPTLIGASVASTSEVDMIVRLVLSAVELKSMNVGWLPVALILYEVSYGPAH
jgi:hypothetical protein